VGLPEGKGKWVYFGYIGMKMCPIPDGKYAFQEEMSTEYIPVP
jgi:hypothetical protein